MTDLHQQAILRLFWHRTRRQFVPLTMMEIERRACLSEAAARGALNRMVRQGQLFSDTTTSPTVYETTADGQAAITAAMMGEAS